MRNMKRRIKAIISYLAVIAARAILAISPKGKRTCQLDDSVLERYGYKLKPLWEGLPTLSASTIDVSIIIPCYNAEKYIRRLLDSALNQQTNCIYEVIAVDDGSTDGTLSVLQDYARRYGHLVVVHQENGGISIARNKGIELAKGEYVGFADNDDYLSQNFIETLYRRAQQTGAGMVQSSYGVVSPEGQQRIFSTPDLVMGIDDMEARGRYVSGYVWLSLYRKSCFERVRFPERFWYEDMVNVMVMKRILGSIVTVSDVLYYKCSRGDSEATIQAAEVDDIRKADQYWLAKSFVEFTTKELGFLVDDVQYRQLLYEFGPMLLRRSRGLQKERRRALFELSANYIAGLHNEERRISAPERVLCQTFADRNYVAWRLMSYALRLA